MKYRTQKLKKERAWKWEKEKRERK